MTSTQPIFLYVEDDPLSRRVMDMLLRRGLGYSQVTIFDSSEAFLACFTQLPAIPDVIFLDIHLRGQDGFALLKRLRGDPRFNQSKIIALTASVTVSEVNHIRSSGFDGLLGKPIRSALLGEQLQAILAGKPIWVVP
ncbi:MAG: response regulator [Anaerolineae bacterium]|nr:response regulator [Anaerolineae bacterium]